MSEKGISRILSMHDLLFCPYKVKEEELCFSIGHQFKFKIQ